MKIHAPFLLTFLLGAWCVSFLGGCHKGSGPLVDNSKFFGKWTFDQDYTKAHLPKEAKPPESPAPKASPAEAASMSKEINGMMNDTLKPMLTEQLITQAQGQSFTVTPKLITDSSGRSRTYEVIERATLNDLSVKMSDGEIWTMTLEDGRMIMPTTGSVHFKLYFKRVGP